MAETPIEWTDHSWNPIVGCTIVSPGCTHCYAMPEAARNARMGAVRYDGLTMPSKAGPVWTGKVALAPDSALLAPLRRRKPTRWFVNSMGDLFHESVPDAWIDRVFAIMALCPQHTFQVLTKRSARMRDYVRPAFDRIVMEMSALVDAGFPTVKESALRHGLTWKQPKSGNEWFPLRNVWLGVSAEDQRRADERIPDLLATPAAIRFISAEPLLGPIDFRDITIPQDVGTWQVNALECDCPIDDDADFHGATLDWIIVGGESGPKARPMHPQWARSIRDQCAAAGTAFFFKQWGEWKDGSDFSPDAMVVLNDGTVSVATRGALAELDRVGPVRPRHPTMMRKVGKKRAGRCLDGVEYNDMPEVRS